MNSSAPHGQRIQAWLVDWACILGWLALMVVVGLGLHQLGVRPGPLGTHVLATMFGVLPACLGLAALESGPQQATVGKRWQGLVVVSANQAERISLGRALVRSGLKVGAPWALGHASAIGLASGAGLTPVLLVLLGCSYAIPVAYLATLLAPPHRPLYDRLTGTTVVLRHRRADRE